MRVIEGFDQLESLTGTELGASEWLTITQEMVDRFADVTLDHQWIHVDADRPCVSPPTGRRSRTGS